MATVKATFYLPLKDNDGRSLAAEIQGVRGDLWTRFMAYTFEGHVEGVYLMADGTQARDVSEKYSLLLDEARLPDVEQILLAFKGRTRQEKMYLEIQHGIEFRLV
jgi:hypothetical protein